MIPEVVIFFGRPDLIVGGISITIGILLLWLHFKVGTPGHFTAGILLIGPPLIIMLFISGSILTAVSGLLTGVILMVCATEGYGYLIQGDNQ